MQSQMKAAELPITITWPDAIRCDRSEPLAARWSLRTPRPRQLLPGRGRIRPGGSHDDRRDHCRDGHDKGRELQAKAEGERCRDSVVGPVTDVGAAG